MIQLMVSRWEEYLGVSVSAQCNHKDPYEGEARGSQAGVNGSTGTEAGMKHVADAGGHYHLQQEKKQILWSLQREHPTDILILACQTHFRCLTSRTVGNKLVLI